MPAPNAAQHDFGDFVTSMEGQVWRSVGLARARSTTKLGPYASYAQAHNKHDSWLLLGQL